MKQTAVEWLDNELREYFFHGNGTLETILKQAKEMEKEQIVNAWMDDRFPLDKDWVKRCAEQYYNQTFNTKEK